MSGDIQYLKDQPHLPKEARAQRSTNRDDMPPGAEVIGRNSPIAVARRGDDSLSGAEIEGYLVGDYTDPLSEESIASAPSLAHRAQGATANKVITDSRDGRPSPVVKVLATGGSLDQPQVPRQAPVRKERTTSVTGERFVKVGEPLERPATPSVSPPAPVAPVAPAVAAVVIPKVAVQISNPAFGTLRVKANFVSASSSVVAIGYVQTEDAFVYEPPALGPESPLTIVCEGKTYVCVSMGISFEAVLPGVEEKVLWVVLVIVPE